MTARYEGCFKGPVTGQLTCFRTDLPSWVSHGVETIFVKKFSSNGFARLENAVAFLRV